jgi:hypothetical protein
MLKIKLKKPTLKQKEILNEWFNTTLYVYNKTLECIKKGHSPLDKQGLRNILVTNETRLKNEEYAELKLQLKDLEKDKQTNKESILSVKQQIKNLPIHKNDIKDWELNTPKDIRASVIDEIVTAHKSGFANLKNGNIKYFHINYKKKDINRRCLSIPKTMVKNVNGKIKIAPTYFKDSSEFRPLKN